MKKAVGVVVFLCHFIQCLDQHWVNNIAGMNCTSYLTKEQHNRISGSTERLISTINDTVLVRSKPLQCPPWYLLKGNTCDSGYYYDDVVQFQPRTGQPLLLPFYCMTTSHNTTHHRDVLGGCLLTMSVKDLTHYFPQRPNPLLKYTTIAFGPLTLFSAAIIAFHISATSTYLHKMVHKCVLWHHRNLKP